MDAAGTVYVADSGAQILIRIAPDRSQTALANDQVFVGTHSASFQITILNVRVDSGGNLYLGFIEQDNFARGDPVVGGLARIGRDGHVTYLTQAGALTPNGLAIGPNGSLYVSQGGITLPGYSTEVRISMIDATGNITTVAGTGASGSGGDGGPATRAQFVEPAGLAFDRSGNLYIADLLDNRVRRISTTGVITTFAGTGAAGFSGDGGLATSAQLDGPSGVAVDQAGSVYIADSKNNRIRKVAPNGTISTVAGAGTPSLQLAPGRADASRGLPLPGDGGPATSAQLTGPRDLTFDASGNLIIADTGTGHVRRVTPDGKISSIV